MTKEYIQQLATEVCREEGEYDHITELEFLRKAYVAGANMVISSPEYVQMKEKSEKWDKVQEVLDGYSLKIHYPDGKSITVIEQQK